MKRRSVVVAALVALLFFTGTARADWSTVPILAEILNSLRNIYSAVKRVRDATDVIKNTLNNAYPESLLDKIGTYIKPVLDIRDEVERLACGWQLSIRAQKIQIGILKGEGFCRKEWHDFFGEPPKTVLEDIDELQDLMTVHHLNVVADYVSRSRDWTDEAVWLTNETLRANLSAGRAQRLAALGAAQLGNTLTEMTKLQAAELDRAENRFNERRLRRRLEQRLAVFLYEGMSDEKNEAAPTLDTVLR